jgi:hypothetical protein
MKVLQWHVCVAVDAALFGQLSAGQRQSMQGLMLVCSKLMVV